MANWNNPRQESTYTQVLGEFKERDEDAAKQFRNYGDNAILGSSWPIGTIRFDGAQWLTWSGTTWSILSTSYNINVDRLGTHSASTAGGAGNIPVCGDTVQTNLNADKLDGYHAGTGQLQIPISNGTVCVNLNADKLDGYDAGTASGNIPISNGNKCTNLNADLLDGYHAGTASGNIPVSNGNKCINLNADMLDGLTSGNNSGNIPISNGSLCVNLNADNLEGLSSGNGNGNIPISNGVICTNLNVEKISGKLLSDLSLAHTHPYLPTNPSSGSATFTGNLTVTGGITESSDAALKYDILPIQGALHTISQLKGSTYKWKSDNKSSIGLIAQEVAKVVPDAVTYGEDGEAVGVQYTRLIALLIEAVKDLNNKLENK